MADETEGPKTEEAKKVEPTDEARERMKSFIRTHYSRTLGEDIKLLDEPGGLEKLHQKYCRGAKS